VRKRGRSASRLQSGIVPADEHPPPSAEEHGS